MFINDRSALRKQYLDAWNKFHAKIPMTDLEKQIFTIIKEHPEYHYIFENPELYLDKTYDPNLEESNPFLHMAMHAVIKDQVSLDMPKGIQEIYHRLMLKYGDTVYVEHHMMEVLIPLIWNTVRHQQAFDTELYLEKLKELS